MKFATRLLAAILPICLLCVLPACGTKARVRPVELTCEYRSDPQGIGSVTPRLAWILEPTRSDDRNLSQRAYRIVAAASRDDLRAGGSKLLWDSGIVPSSDSSGIEYRGAPLGSRANVEWRVMVVDQDGEHSDWSDAAHFSIGLIDRAEWKGEWIGLDLDPAPPLTADIREWLRQRPWIRQPGGPERNAREAFFRTECDIAQDELAEAFFAGTADQIAELRINGVAVAPLTRWDMVRAIDVSRSLRPGRNAIGIRVKHDDGFHPAVSGGLVLRSPSGAVRTIPLETGAKLGGVATPGWDTAGFDDSAWTPAEVSMSQPWGSNRNTEHFLPPVVSLRTTFDIPESKRVIRATLYSTALGVYRPFVNGYRAGNDELSPGWTEYTKRVYHQTFDVTNLITQGRNVLGVELGDGWYASALGFTATRYFYGGKPRFIGQLELEYADGGRDVIASSQAWRAASSGWTHADLYLGCEADLRAISAGWHRSEFSDASWRAPACGLAPARATREADVTTKVAGVIGAQGGSLVVAPTALGDPAYGVRKTLRVEYAAAGVSKTIELPESATLALPRQGESLPIVIKRAVFGEPARHAPVEPLIQPQPGEPMREQQTIRAIARTEPAKGRYIYDLGQNLVGWARISVTGTSGQRVTVRHAEMLNPDGTMYTSNLRGATATDFYTLRDGLQTLEPVFTFHGFRYVEITGVDAPPAPADVLGVVVHTSMPPAGTFESSSPLLNQLVHNIEWGQKGNYLDVPTDCPQRDERFGWTGDAQFFMNAAAYNFDIGAFMSRWLVTLCEDAQHEDGTFADVAPKVSLRGGSTAWGDAAIVCTHAMHRIYGDTRSIREHYPEFKKYIAWLDSRTTNGIAKVGGYGDWLNLNDPTSSDLIDTAYRAELLRMMIEFSQVLGESADASRFELARTETVRAFRERFLQTDGSLKESGQTGYALLFSMPGLLPDDLRATAAAHFVRAIEKRDNHLATGFIGTPRLLPSLFAANQDATAGMLLLQEDYPSWLYQVKLGATTMWERWDGWTPERGFSDVGMNSFNHYAFGSVGDALYGAIAGITPLEPGYARVMIAPRPVAGIPHIRATYRSIRGSIGVEYQQRGDGIAYTITVPPNVSADLRLRGSPGGPITVSQSLGSGTWTFVVPK